MNMSQIQSISEISVGDLMGLRPTPKVTDTEMIYHVCSTPFFINLKEFNLPTKEDNPTEYYFGKYQNSNRGNKGKLWKCKNCGLEIPIGNPLYRLTECKEIDYDYGDAKGKRIVFKSWLFGNENCLRQWITENNPNEMI